MGKKKKKKQESTEDLHYKAEVEKYKDRLVKIIENQVEKFDQKIIYIAGGAFAISSVFIDKVVKLDKAISKGYLTGALCIFASVVILALIAHFISIKANTWAHENYGESSDDVLFSTKRSRWNCAINTINYITIGLLIIGSLFLLYFIDLNI
ncbi:MAG: hypothetical protein V4643_07210 [Bacteroidota bacterium]